MVVNMERKLASIQLIKDLQPIVGADKIKVATVLGWQCVVKNEEFNIGDKCVYFEIDSILPIAPWNDHLRKDGKPVRVKTIRLRGQLSQGLALPMSLLPVGEYELNQDVTELIGVEKYELPVPAQLAGQVKGNFPSVYISKTDEIRIQTVEDVIQECIDNELDMIGSLKCDGSSMTSGFIPYPNELGEKRNEFVVCSRNLNLKETEDNAFWKMARTLKLEENLSKLDHPYVVQGELLGPGIQKNRMGFNELTFRVFNVKNIDSNTYLDRMWLERFCYEIGLTIVPIVARKVFTKEDTIQSLLELSNSLMYDTGHPAEGIVWRSAGEVYSEVLKGRMSFKVISNKYLELTKE